MHRNPWGKKSYFHPGVMRDWLCITSLPAFSLLLLLPHLLNSNCFGLVFYFDPQVFLLLLSLLPLSHWEEEEEGKQVSSCVTLSCPLELTHNRSPLYKKGCICLFLAERWGTLREGGFYITPDFGNDKWETSQHFSNVLFSWFNVEEQQTEQMTVSGGLFGTQYSWHNVLLASSSSGNVTRWPTWPHPKKCSPMWCKLCNTWTPISQMAATWF